jgi:predicted metal-binding membrane protein
MGGIPMPGGWTMSMAWMRSPGQTWPGAAASFVAMWAAMTVPMMLPVLAPMLRRYRAALPATGTTRRIALTALVAAAYYLAWTAVGALVFPVGAALGAIAMREPAMARAVPLAAGVLVLVAGALQFSRWKGRHLGCCREPRWIGGAALPADMVTACRHGLRLAFDCGRCCGNLMLVLLAAGVMDPWAMTAVTAAMAAERLAPAGRHVARGIGTVIVAAGGVLVARAAGLW